MSLGARLDRGMTLVELLVVVVLLGLIVTALASAISVFLRTQDGPVDKVDRSRGLQQLVNYFPADVGSAQFIEVSAPWSAPCLSLGTPILNMFWVEAFPDRPNEEVSVTYVLSADGTRLTRNVCGSSPSNNVVARDLLAAEAEFRDTVTSTVDLRLDFDGESRTMSGSSRNCENPDEC